ncbi:MAG: sialate O-acetylesterase [Bacteroidota bacterium]
MKKLIILSFSLLLSTFSFAQLRLPSVIGSHMVLQQRSETPLWGWARNGEKISVTTSWDQQTVSAFTGADGKWMVKVKTPAAGGPYTIQISGKKKILLEDILIGEVWVCSGQSNMEMPLKGWPSGPIDNSDAEVAAANYPKMRLFSVPRNTSYEPVEDCKSSWVECKPETAKDFSATGYFFGRELLRKLNVPVGLIFTSWGGTVAEAWMSKEYVEQIPWFTTSSGTFDPIAFKKRQFEKYAGEQAAWGASVGFVPDQKVPLWAIESDSDPAWTAATVPSNWDQTFLGDHIGLADYRMFFTVPDSWIDKDLVLELGPIDEMDMTWINGTLVGSHLNVYDWATKRVYKVPAGIMKKGENMLAIRVANTSGIGGINGDPGMLKIRPEKSRTKWQPLAGTWKVRKGESISKVAPSPECVDCNEPNVPTVLYNGMITPILPFGIKGAIWYQGESNRYDGELYKKIFPDMIANWRHDWNQGDFPFYFIQIAPYTYRDNFSTGLLREAQDYTMRTVPNTGMVVTMDIGNLKNIHPGNKQDIGKRLAFWALKKDYGFKDIACTAPVYKTYKIEGNQIRISFDLFGQQLKSDGRELTCFQIAGDDYKFVPAKAVIDSGTLLVSAGGITHPVAVRFAWNSTDEPNLSGTAGLPVGPFRTDNQ